MSNQQNYPHQGGYQSGYTNPNHQYQQQPQYNQGYQQAPNQGYQQAPNQGYQQQSYNPGYQQAPYNPGFQRPQYNPYDEFPNASQSWRNNDVFADGPSGKNRGVFALLALFLGAFGIQYFYLGKVGGGLLFAFLYWFLIIVSCFYGVAIVGWVPLIQGVIVFCMNNARFERTFCNPNSFMPLF